MKTDSVHPLRAWREENGLTLAALSARLGQPEIKISTLSYYEAGKRLPKPAQMQRLRELTGIPADAFYAARRAEPAE